jgi:hypothetical protein
MPRFLYSVLFLTVVTLVGLILIIWKLSPELMISRLLFFGDLTIAVTLGLSVIFYYLNATRKKLFVEPRNLYRKQLRRSFLIAIFLDGLLAFKFWGGFNKLNILLFLLFILALEVFMNRRNTAQMVK